LHCSPVCLCVLVANKKFGLLLTACRVQIIMVNYLKTKKKMHKHSLLTINYVHFGTLLH
jgi:hypothetical protein